MNQHQMRMWKRMIQLLGEFEHIKLSLRRLVNGLEGAMDTANFREGELKTRWYGFWTPLEDLDDESSREMEAPDFIKTRVAAERMKSFLLEEQRVWSHGFHARV